MFAFGLHGTCEQRLGRMPVIVPDELTLALARIAELRVQIECMQERIRIMRSRVPRMLERLRDIDAGEGE